MKPSRPVESPSVAHGADSTDIFTVMSSDPFRGPWLTAREAAAYVRNKSVNAFYKWRVRHGIVTRNNGTVAKADLDRALKVKRVRPDCSSHLPKRRSA